MLDLGKRGHVVFRGLADGTVVIAKRDDVTDDPVIGKFLAGRDRGGRRARTGSRTRSRGGAREGCGRAAQVLDSARRVAFLFSCAYHERGDGTTRP
jgi:antitoxin PrlF